jgi:hypothetical protein
MGVGVFFEDTVEDGIAKELFDASLNPVKLNNARPRLIGHEVDDNLIKITLDNLEKLSVDQRKLLRNWFAERGTNAY